MVEKCHHGLEFSAKLVATHVLWGTMYLHNRKLSRKSYLAYHFMVSLFCRMILILPSPKLQLEIYQAFIEEVLRQTSEDHIDYRSLGSALEAIQDLKMVGLYTYST